MSTVISTTIDSAGISKPVDSIYIAFSFDAGKEPDWKTIRAVALKGAVFVAEPAAGKERFAATVEEFIEKYKKSIDEMSLRTTGYQEKIIYKTVSQSGNVANVEVSFIAFIPGDNRPGKPGLDNIQLLNDGGKWKIVAFTTQSESMP